MQSNKQRNIKHRDDSYKKDNLHILSVNMPADIDYHMGNGLYGSYDGRILRSTISPALKKVLTNMSSNNAKYFVPQGTQLPLKEDSVYTQLPTDSMFLFSKNIASPACCPSTYSTSNGCVCTTQKQRDLVSIYRGNNKSFPDDGF